MNSIFEMMSSLVKSKTYGGIANGSERTDEALQGMLTPDEMMEYDMNRKMDRMRLIQSASTAAKQPSLASEHNGGLDGVVQVM